MPRFSLKLQSGFTMIEAVMVIVILGIIAAGTTAFISQGMQSYLDTSRRDQLASMGRIAVEKIVRDLRDSHPSTIRVVFGCLEHMSILGSGTYQDQNLIYTTGTPSIPLPNNAAAGTSFDAFQLSVVPTVNDYILAGTEDPYAAPLVPRFNGFSVVALPANVQRMTINPAHLYTGQSPARRVYALAAPAAYCIVGSELRRYSGYAINANPTTGAPVLNAEDIQVTSSFSYTPGTLVRNGLVHIALDIARDGEQVRITHEAQIRNVP